MHLIKERMKNELQQENVEQKCGIGKRYVEIKELNKKKYKKAKKGNL